MTGLTDAEREALTDALSRCKWPDGGYEGMPTKVTAPMIVEQCAPVLEQILTARLSQPIAVAQADAWDQGYARGVRDEAGDMERADNPYTPRADGERTAGEQLLWDIFGNESTARPESGEVDALADALGDIRVADARRADWWTNDEDHRLLIQVLRAECRPWAEGLLASGWLARRDKQRDREVRRARVIDAVVADLAAKPPHVLSDAAQRVWLGGVDAVAVALRAALGDSTESES